MLGPNTRERAEVGMSTMAKDGGVQQQLELTHPVKP
jgi:hypothetical protein